MTTARPSPSGLQRRVVVLLFADLEGYTALCEDLDPEDVLALVRPLMLRLRGSAEEAGAVVPGIQGDGFMAVFGALQSSEDVGQRAVAAARAMQELVVSQRQASPLTLPMLRVGIHVGEVAVSWDDRFGGELVVSGDAVNVASRVCAAAPAGAVLVTSALLGLVPDESADPGRDLQVRNRREPVRVSVLPVQPGRVRHAPISTLMVDREGLRSRLDGLLPGTGREAGPAQVCLVGEVGAGKTRAVEEWMLTLGADVLTVVVAPPGPSGGPLGLLPEGLLDAVRPAGERGGETTAAPSAPTGSRDVEARRAADVLLGSRPDPLRRRRLMRVLGASVDTDELDSLEEQLSTVIEVLAEQPGPVVVLLDAVERQPGVLRDGLAQMRSPNAVLVATAREHWGAVRNVTVEPLSDDSVTLLIQRLLPGCPAPLAELLSRRSGGNPLYVEQLVAGVVESGAVTTDASGLVVVADPAAVSRTPTAMRVFVGARLERLTDEQATVLRLLAVYDEAVPTSALAALVPAGLDLESALRGLARSHLVRTAADEVVLRHALIAEVTRSGMARRDAMALHIDAARELVSRGTMSSQRAGAEHWVSAWRLRRAVRDPVDGLDGQALDAVLGVASSWASDPLESLRWLATAHEIASLLDAGANRPRLLRLVALEAAALESSGREREAIVAATVMAEHATMVGDDAAATRAHLHRARCLDLLGLDAAAAEALAAARVCAPAAGLARAEVELTAVWILAADRLAVLADSARSALSLARESGEEQLARQLESRLLQCLAEVGGPRWEAARAASAAQVRDDDVALRAVLGLADATHALAGGDDDAAAKEFGQALALAEPLGLVQISLPARVLAVEALARSGRLDEARQVLSAAEVTVAQRPHGRPGARLALASARFRQRTGSPSHARQSLSVARQGLSGADLLELRLIALELQVERGLRVDAAEVAVLERDLVSAAMAWWVVHLRWLAAASAVLPHAVAHDPVDLPAGAAAAWAVLSRWQRQLALLAGTGAEADSRRLSTPPEGVNVAEARALDAENAGLGAVAAGRLQLAAAMFNVAQGHWMALGYTVWRARAGIWLSEVTGSDAMAGDARHVLATLESPAGLEADFRAQVRALSLAGGDGRR